MYSSLTYNDMLGAYDAYPIPIRPYLLRAETHPQLTPLLTKSFMKVLIDILARAPIKDPLRPLKLRVDVVANDLGISTKTVGRAIYFMQQQGWFSLYRNQYGRNRYGEFGAREFLLSVELRTLLGLPTAHPSSLSNNENHGEDEKKTVPPSLNTDTIDQGVTTKSVGNSTTETKMSHGAYKVNKIFKKEASFQEEASKLKTQKNLPQFNSTTRATPCDSTKSENVKQPKLPPELDEMAETLNIHPWGICSLMRLAKQCRQRLQDVWKVKRDQLINAGVKEGRAFRYVEFLLQTGEDFAFRAQKVVMKKSPASTEYAISRTPEKIDHRIYWNKRFTGNGGLQVRIHGDGSAAFTNTTHSNSYICPADMGSIYEAIAIGKLWLLEE